MSDLGEVQPVGLGGATPDFRLVQVATTKGADFYSAGNAGQLRSGADGQSRQGCAKPADRDKLATDEFTQARIDDDHRANVGWAHPCCRMVCPSF